MPVLVYSIIAGLATYLATGGDKTSSTLMTLFIALITYVETIGQHQFGVGNLVTVCFSFVGWIFSHAGVVAGGDVQAKMTNMSSVLQSDVFTKCWYLALYLLEPVLYPDVVNACCTAVVNVWAYAMCFKALVIVKGYAWSGGAA